MSLPKAEDLEQLEEIEKQWAVKAMHHAETYFSLLEAMDGSKLKLTKIDDEIYNDWVASFGPDLPRIDILDEDKDFKSPAMKEKWRNFIQKYEGKVTDYNFGSLLRIDVSQDYTRENTMFVTRIQFLTIEIARNKAGLNLQHYKKN